MGKDFKKISKIYKNTLSPITISKEEFLLKLRKASFPPGVLVPQGVTFSGIGSLKGLILKSTIYKAYNSDNEEVRILYESSRLKLLNLLRLARDKKESVKFIFLIHDSSSGKPNTLLNSNGVVRCWKCSLSLGFDSYLAYFLNNSLDLTKSCDVAKTFKSKSLAVA